MMKFVFSYEKLIKEVIDDSEKESIPCEESEAEDRMSLTEGDFSFSSFGSDIKSNKCDDDYVSSRDGTQWTKKVPRITDRRL